MEADRRVVRVAASFFDQLDVQLGPNRGSEGEPSATDFLVLDLPVIVDHFATNSSTRLKSSKALGRPEC